MNLPNEYILFPLLDRLYVPQWYFVGLVLQTLMAFNCAIDNLCAVVAEDAMEAWDQEKLEDVVDKKHGSKNKGLPPTTIVSMERDVFMGNRTPLL